MPVPQGEDTMTKPLQMHNVTRVEVIDSTGRAFARHYEPGMEIHVQDEGRTIKIFAGMEAQR